MSNSRRFRGARHRNLPFKKILEAKPTEGPRRGQRPVITIDEPARPTGPPGSVTNPIRPRRQRPKALG